MDELTRSAQKHYALEQELSMYKIDARFRDLGPPPPFNPNEVRTSNLWANFLAKLKITHDSKTNLERAI